MSLASGLHYVVLFSAYAVLWVGFYLAIGFGWLEL